MESCCLESKEELAALRVAELYQGMARLRTDKPVTYFHDNNPRKSRYWKSFMAIAILCEEKGYDPQIYLQAQFEMLNADWCRKVWRSKNPPPNVCHSEKALERYEKYLKRCDARMGAPMKKATTVADWFKCLTIHALRSATDHLIRELRFNDGALTNWRDADLAQVRTRAVVAALDTTWGGVLLAQAKDPFTQTYVADTFAHVDTKAYTNVLKMVADPKNREILSQIYQEVKIHSLEEYDSYQEGAEARMAFEAIESYLAGEPLTLPVAPPRSAEAKKRVRIRQRMLKVGAFVSGEGQLHYGRVI